LEQHGWAADLIDKRRIEDSMNRIASVAFVFALPAAAAAYAAPQSGTFGDLIQASQAEAQSLAVRSASRVAFDGQPNSATGERSHQQAGESRAANALYDRSSRMLCRAASQCSRAGTRARRGAARLRDAHRCNPNAAALIEARA
jgi:hypothetical protein